MTMFLESPWPAIVIGAAALGLLGVAYQNTGQPRLRTAMFGVPVVVLALLLVEWLIVTQREAISNTLEDMAVALESNQLEAVMAYLAPEAAKIRSDAQQYLPGVEISDANIGGDLQVVVNRLTNPPSARATFTGRISGANRSPAERSPYENLVRKFTLTLRQEGDRWLITGYEMGGPR
jgi:hypothetical protein